MCREEETAVRCGCPDCGTYMVHADGPELGCVCPECGRRCRDCLGTDTVLSLEQIRREAENLCALFDRQEACWAQEDTQEPPRREF